MKAGYGRRAPAHGVSQATDGGLLDFCAVLHFCYIMYNIYKFDFVIRGLYNIFNKQDSAVLYFYHQTAGFFV